MLVCSYSLAFRLHKPVQLCCQLRQNLISNSILSVTSFNTEKELPVPVDTLIATEKPFCFRGDVGVSPMNSLLRWLPCPRSSVRLSRSLHEASFLSTACCLVVRLKVMKRQYLRSSCVIKKQVYFFFFCPLPYLGGDADAVLLHVHDGLGHFD